MLNTDLILKDNPKTSKALSLLKAYLTMIAQEYFYKQEISFKKLLSLNA